MNEYANPENQTLFVIAAHRWRSRRTKANNLLTS